MIPATQKAYIYIRWSSDKQNPLESEKRQLDSCQKFAEAQGLSIAEVMKDEGLSAFSGIHRKKGKLGGFLTKAQNKTLPQGSWLIIENLDRLSREAPEDSQFWLLMILQADVTIHAINENLTIKPRDPSSYLALMQAFMRSGATYDESKGKSTRTLSAAHNALLRNEAGEKYLACTSAGKPPWWITREQRGRDYYSVLKPDCAKLTKLMIDLTFKGMGSERIAKHLNKHHLPRPEGLKGDWKSTFVSKTLSNTAIFGEFNINLKASDSHAARNYSIQGYYPALISKERFYKMRAIKKQAKTPQRTDEYVSLFGGMNIIKCHYCGGSMYHNRQGGGKKHRYMCLNGQQGAQCKPWSFCAEYLEDLLLRLCNNQIIQPLIDSTLQQEKDRLEMQLSDVRTEQKRLIKLSKKIDDIEALEEELIATKLEIRDLEQSLHSIEVKVHEEQREAIQWGGIDPKITDPHQHDIRREIRPRIADSVKSIVCAQIKRAHIKFKITFKNKVEINCEREKKTMRFLLEEWAQLAGDANNQEMQDEFMASHLDHLTSFGLNPAYKHAPEVIQIGLNGCSGITYATAYLDIQ